jgi:Mor family transcriptional regulator
MEEETKRNQQIFADKQKMSYTGLVLKYRLSLTRIQQIVRREKIKNNKNRITEKK